MYKNTCKEFIKDLKKRWLKIHFVKSWKQIFWSNINNIFKSFYDELIRDLEGSLKITNGKHNISIPHVKTQSKCKGFQET